MKSKWNSNSVFRGALRRAYVKSPQVKAVKLAARRETPKYNKDGSLSKRANVDYQCAVCEGWYKDKYMQVDHITPVIDSDTGWVDWNTFVERLDSDVNNLQYICSYTKKHEDATGEFGRYSCHYTKTQEERRLRRERSE